MSKLIIFPSQMSMDLLEIISLSSYFLLKLIRRFRSNWILFHAFFGTPKNKGKI